MFEATNIDGKDSDEITLEAPSAIVQGTFTVNPNEGITGETSFELTYDNWLA